MDWLTGAFEFYIILLHIKKQRLLFGNMKQSLNAPLLLGILPSPRHFAPLTLPPASSFLLSSP